jgi:acetyl-CoA carboxylase biotin carboxyl carrier protein
MDLTPEDVAEIVALLDSLPYDELDVETPRFRLTLRRTPAGWTQSSEVRSAPNALSPVAADTGGLGEVFGAGEASTRREPAPAETTSMEHRGRYSDSNGPSMSLGKGRGAAAAGESGADEAREAGGAGADGAGLVAVRAPLPGTFYRAPRPGAAPFAEVGSQVDADTVIGIVETMKLMNPVHAGVAGTVAEFRVANAEFAAHGATLLLIRADR